MKDGEGSPVSVCWYCNDTHKAPERVSEVSEACPKIRKVARGIEC